MLEYIKLNSSSGARQGLLKTRRGIIETPAFMPVGTYGVVRSLLSEEVALLGAKIILANTYHLLLRPGLKVIEKIGGLHHFIHWKGPILTDSGGYQIFSLASLCKIDEIGVSFRSHLNGSLLTLTPELVISAQEKLGSDIMMMLDECPPAHASKDYLEKAIQRDARWAVRARAIRSEVGGALMGIIQGGTIINFRRVSAKMLVDLDLDGYALGGLNIGESKEIMMDVIRNTIPCLPQDKPIYLMGVGDPTDLVACVGLGADLFDCVLPTRMARNGTLLTSYGRINIRNARYIFDPKPIEEGCFCPTCIRYSRAYLRHLFISKELLAYRLNTEHNLYYILNLMARLREAISKNCYPAFARKVLDDLLNGQKEFKVTDN